MLETLFFVCVVLSSSEIHMLGGFLFAAPFIKEFKTLKVLGSAQLSGFV